MFNVESELWKAVGLNSAYVQITQKASRTTRTVLRSDFPHDAHALAMMHELRFNRLCREAFHNTPN